MKRRRRTPRPSRKRAARADKRSRVVIAAIDPGTRIVGYCFLAPRGLRLETVAVGTIEAKGSSRPARLREIHDRIQELFERHRPDQVVVERAYVGRNAQSAIILGEARGIALLCAARAGAEVHEYTAPEAKRAVTLNGLSSKSGVQRAIQLLLGLASPLPPDASDAAALALLHAGRAR